MKSAIILVSIILCSATAFPATIYVPDHYSEIQDAIDASSNGDTVIVRSGTYVENIDFNGKAITVVSESGPSATVIDGGNPSNPDFGSVVYFQNGEGPDSVLEGFTIMNGSGTHSANGARGGGIYVNWASPTIVGNWIQVNTAACGGGIYIYSSSAVIEDNTISANTTTPSAGAGIAIFENSDCTVTGNVIRDNTSAANGGSIFASESFPLIEKNTISGNKAFCGGGLQCSFGAATVLDNSIVDNSSDTRGGGIYLYESNSLVKGNLIAGNDCDTGGGGIWSDVNDSSTITGNIIRDNSVLDGGWGGGGIAVLGSTPKITDNWLTGNSADVCGGAISLGEDADALIAGNTIFGNWAVQGGGIRCYSCAPTISNTILWNNDAQYGPAIRISSTNYPSTLDISYSDVEGGQASVYVDSGCTLNWGPGMIDADPLFADAASEDFHLTWNSPCRDTGDNSAVTQSADFEGDPRIALGTVDMGADEYYYHLYHVGAVVPGSPIEIKVVGYPGAPVLLALGSGIQDPPANTQHGDLWLQWPPLWEGEIGPASGDGFAALTVTVPTAWTSGSEHPFQALAGPWGGPWTRITNLEVLVVE